MPTPISNGIVEITPRKQIKESGFFCMKLVEYIGTEAEPGTEEYADMWKLRFSQAKKGECHYKDQCPIYTRTIAKQQQEQSQQAKPQKPESRQLALDF